LSESEEPMDSVTRSANKVNTVYKKW
jgi:hypothetical protein